LTYLGNMVFLEDELPNISDDFLLKENLLQPRPKSSPYTKQERLQRRNKVYRLHFEYGYSARKIAELMNVNRNTINGDVEYWYNQVMKNWRYADPEVWIIKCIHRLELQKTRLRERLDKVENPQEILLIEKLILDLESKIIQTELKLVNNNHEFTKQLLEN